MDTLGLFAKWPAPGQVKTRLAARTSALWAAQAARAFLLDLLDRLAGVNARRVLAFSPPEAEADIAGLVHGRFGLTTQGDGDLGRRMAMFFTEQFRSGSERVVLLGSDSPTVPVAYVEQAFRELDRADVVLGPATDGGYYLVGCKGRVPPVFHEIPWSSPRVLRDTVARLADPSWRLAVLPPWYDVDTLDDWWLLRGHMQAMRRAGLDPGVPHTEAVGDPPRSADWRTDP
jgi:rSAM/selenodomain-associated transferase 1